MIFNVFAKVPRQKSRIFLYGLRRPVLTMDDAPSVGCRGTFTAGTASAVTRQSDLWKAGFSTSGTGVDGHWLYLACACLSSGSLSLGQGLDLLLLCLELSLKRRAPIAAVSCHVFPAPAVDVQDFQTERCIHYPCDKWKNYWQAVFEYSSRDFVKCWRNYFGRSTFIMRSTSLSVTGRQWKTSGDRSFVGSNTEQDGSISNLWLTARSWAFCNVMNMTEHTWQKDWNVMNMLLWGFSLLKEAKPHG